MNGPVFVVRHLALRWRDDFSRITQRDAALRIVLGATCLAIAAIELHVLWHALLIQLAGWSWICAAGWFAVARAAQDSPHAGMVLASAVGLSVVLGAAALVLKSRRDRWLARERPVGARTETGDGTGLTAARPSPPQDVADAAATLVSASCTTGWSDWVHGELWLCPEGLVRRSLGLRATVRHASRRNRPTVDEAHRPRHVFTEEEIARIVAADRRNRWVTWGEILHATLEQGSVDLSLHLQLRDGRRETLLWLRVDGGHDLVEEALGRALGGRFNAPDRPL